MGFIKLFIESTKPKIHAQKNSFYFLLGYFISVFYYLQFNIIKVALGFVIFLSVYSCVYVVNDIFDYTRDKKHPIKKYRPIPSDKLNPTHALILCGLIYITGFVTSFILINPLFAMCMFLLVIGNVAYSHPFFKTKKNYINAGLLLAGLQYLKLLAGWSINAGDINFPVVYFMIPACLYLYCLFQVAIHSDHYKGRFKFNKQGLILGKALMILPAIMITVLLFTDLVFYMVCVIIPVYFAFLFVVRKLKFHDAILKINRYMTYLNSLLVSLNLFFYLGVSKLLII
jgi:hypothetical protein